jgi:hypothetical protein
MYNYNITPYLFCQYITGETLSPNQIKDDRDLRNNKKWWEHRDTPTTNYLDFGRQVIPQDRF